GVNDHGDCVGLFYDENDRLQAFIFTDACGFQRIPELAVASGINNAGQVVGAVKRDGVDRGAVYTIAGGTAELGPLLDDASASCGGECINELGQVVGFSGQSREHACRHTPGIGAADLGTLGGNRSEGWGINRRGDVVGLSVKSAKGNVWRPFLYSDS